MTSAPTFVSRIRRCLSWDKNAAKAFVEEVQLYIKTVTVEEIFSKNRTTFGEQISNAGQSSA